MLKSIFKYDSFSCYTMTDNIFKLLTLSCQFHLRIKLSNVAIRKSNLSLLPEHGLRITADNASGNIGAVWHYKESSWFVLTKSYLLIE